MSTAAPLLGALGLLSSVQRFRALLLFGTLALAGCGAAPAPDLHAAFQRIQEHEAVIVRRVADAETCEADAPCPAREAVCDAAAAICDIAREIDDADAHARCTLAERRCGAER